MSVTAVDIQARNCNLPLWPQSSVLLEVLCRFARFGPADCIQFVHVKSQACRAMSC